MWAPSTGWKDCRCEVTRVGAGIDADVASAAFGREEVTRV
jgi:hypothetical protein